VNRHLSYQILGISSGATETEIGKAYRRLVMEYHPDRNPGDPEAEGKFTAVQRAYEFLSSEGATEDNHKSAAYLRQPEGFRPDLTNPCRQ
jgi:molecular chaperone DnaJ